MTLPSNFYDRELYLFGYIGLIAFEPSNTLTLDVIKKINELLLVSNSESDDEFGPKFYVLNSDQRYSFGVRIKAMQKIHAIESIEKEVRRVVKFVISVYDNTSKNGEIKVALQLSQDFSDVHFAEKTKEELYCLFNPAEVYTFRI